MAEKQLFGAENQTNTGICALRVVISDVGVFVEFSGLMTAMI